MTRLGLVAVALLAGCVDMEGADDPSPPPNEPTIGLSGSPSNGTIHAAFAQGAPGMYEMTSDATHLYWVDIGTPNNVTHVRRMPLAGGPVETLFTAPGYALSLAVADGFVYFARSQLAAGGEIYKMPTTGGTPTVLTTAVNPMKISVDGGWVYYSVGSVAPDGAILRVPTTGGTPEVVVCDVDNPWDFVADRGTLYYTDAHRGRMMRVVAGHSPTVVVDGFYGLGWMTLDDAFVYFTAVMAQGEGEAPSLYRVPRDGGALDKLVVAALRESKLAVVGDHLQWGQWGTDTLSAPTVTQFPSYSWVNPQRVSAVTARPDAAYYGDFVTGEIYRSGL